MYFRGRSKPAPVSVGEELDVTIEAVGEKGDGVAKKDGFVLFVPNVQQGDRVRVKVTKVLRKVGFAEKIGEAESEPAEMPEPQSFEETKVDSESFGEEAEPAEESETPVSEESESEMPEPQPESEAESEAPIPETSESEEQEKPE